MPKGILLRRICILLFIIAVLDYLGLALQLHWTVWWFDMVLHFLGGASVGIFAIWLWTTMRGEYPKTKFQFIIISVTLAFIVGFLWEALEIFLGAASFSDGIIYVRDTTSDLILDVCGGFFASLYSYNKVN